MEDPDRLEDIVLLSGALKITFNNSIISKIEKSTLKKKAFKYEISNGAIFFSSIGNPYRRLMNSFSWIMIRSLDFNNLFSWIVICSI